MEFYAKLKKEGSDWLVTFPDLPNIHTFGESPAHALDCASEALNAVLESDFERGFSLPQASNLKGKRGAYPIRVLPHIAIAYELRRLRKGHPQSAIAKKLGVSYQAYQKLENPRRCNPTLKTLEKIGAALGRTLTVSLD